MSVCANFPGCGCTGSCALAGSPARPRRQLRLRHVFALGLVCGLALGGLAGWLATWWLQ